MTQKVVLVVLAAIAMILPGQAAMGDLTAYWSFDADYTSSVNSATMDGAASSSQVSILATSTSNVGQVGAGCLKIDDIDNTSKHCVVINNPIANWASNPTITVMGWYQVTDFGDGHSDGRRYIWETGTDTGGDYVVSTQVYSTDVHRWACLTTGGNFKDLSGPTIVDDQWNHMAWVYNTDTMTAKYYHNGQLRDYRTIPAGYQTLKTDAGKFFIGSARGTYKDRNFDGYMDEVAVFSHEPTGQVIADIVSGAATPATASSAVAPDRGFNLIETNRWSVVDVLTTDDPGGVAVASDGTVYATRRNKDTADGGVYRVDTGSTTKLATEHMCADVVADSDGDLFFVSDYDGVIRRIEAGTGTVSDWITDPDGDAADDDPIALFIVPDTFDGGAGSLVSAGDGLVVDRDDDIYIWSPDTAGTSSLLNDGTEMSDPLDIAVSESEIFAIDNGTDQIFKMDLTDGSLTALTTTTALSNPISIVVDPNSGDLLVMCDSDTEPTKVVRVNPDTGTVTTIIDTILDGYGDPNDGATFTTWLNRSKMTMSADGQYLYIAEQDGDAIYQLKAVPEPSTMALLLAGLLGLVGLRRRM